MFVPNAYPEGDGQGRGVSPRIVLVGPADIQVRARREFLGGRTRSKADRSVIAQESDCGPKLTSIDETL
jgi:hypothetical protein